jgi:CheY-like chemotaxis protein
MKTILVVDDEFDLAGTLRAVLEGEGYRVSTCPDGRAAIESLQGSKPDLMLMDVMLPIMDGLEVLRQMRQTPGLDGVPVVLMSAITPDARREDYRWQAFLSKPFGLEELIATVDRLIGAAGPGER